MVASADVRCVVCELSPAVLYCQQDDAHLCESCDQQVHSANPLASRHHRVALKQCAHMKNDEQAVPEARSVFDADPRGAPEPTAEVDACKEFAFDDDAFFAVPDIDLPGSAADDGPAKSVLGKTFISDEFDFGEIDPLWLDRLDVGLDRLPSDILDSLVPEAPPPARPTRQPSAAQSPLAASPPPAVQPPPMRAHRPQSARAPMRHPALHHYAAPTMVPHFAPPAEVVAVKWEQPPAAPEETALDVENYIPRSLLPIDPTVRVQQLRARREKLERFREKKRNRHFKKTIRYASRKAYAEVRPRIKGRFARKDEVAAMRAAGLLPVA